MWLLWLSGISRICKQAKNTSSNSPTCKTIVDFAGGTPFFVHFLTLIFIFWSLQGCCYLLLRKYEYWVNENAVWSHCTVDTVSLGSFSACGRTKSSDPSALETSDTYMVNIPISSVLYIYIYIYIYIYMRACVRVCERACVHRWKFVFIL